METYVNQSDADALLPPRKRILAGMKRQNSDVNPSLPSPSIPGGVVREHDVHNKIHRFRVGNPDLSKEDIVEASRIAAVEAKKVAEAARAYAEEKAAKAAKAVVAAKNALEIAASLSEEASNKENFRKRGKMKKHLQVESLYNKNKGNTNCQTDEELARKLHRVINSSPRILKNSSDSDSKNHKNKHKPGGECNPLSTSTSNGNVIIEDMSSDDTIKELDTVIKMLGKCDQLELNDGDDWEPNKAERLKLDKSDLGPFLLKDKFTKSLDTFCKRRVRIKQKKLPLSSCSFKDENGTKEKLKLKGMS